MALREEIEQAINKNNAENGSDTPDFILADYLMDCLTAYDKSVNARENWYGRQLKENQTEEESSAKWNVNIKNVVI